MGVAEGITVALSWELLLAVAIVVVVVVLLVYLVKTIVEWFLPPPPPPPPPPNPRPDPDTCRLIDTAGDVCIYLCNRENLIYRIEAKLSELAQSLNQDLADCPDIINI